MLTTCQEWHHVCHMFKNGTMPNTFQAFLPPVTHVYYLSSMPLCLLHVMHVITSRAWHLVYNISCMGPGLPPIMHDAMSTSCHAWLHVYHYVYPLRMAQGLPPCQAWHYGYHLSSMALLLSTVKHGIISINGQAWHCVYHRSSMAQCLPSVKHGIISINGQAWHYFYQRSSMALCLPSIKHGTMSTIGQAWHYFYQRSSMALCLPGPHDLVYQQSSMTLCLTPCKAYIISTNHPYFYSFEKRKLFMGFFHIIMNHRHAFPFLPWNIPFCHANNILTG
jgi:hypothetical protein